MNPDTAERAAPAVHPRPFADLRADEGRMTALRESWRALWSSRLLVWTGGAGTVALFGFGPSRGDGACFLVIAHYGYRPDLVAFTGSRTAFFPLYPLALRAIAWLGAPPVLAGVALSIAALGIALYGIHRLSTFELSRARLLSDRARVPEAARLAVALTAFAPMALYFSALYTESLSLALSA